MPCLCHSVRRGRQLHGPPPTPAHPPNFFVLCLAYAQMDGSYPPPGALLGALRMRRWTALPCVCTTITTLPPPLFFHWVPCVCGGRRRGRGGRPCRRSRATPSAAPPSPPTHATRAHARRRHAHTDRRRRGPLSSSPARFTPWSNKGPLQPLGVTLGGCPPTPRIPGSRTAAAAHGLPRGGTVQQGSRGAVQHGCLALRRARAKQRLITARPAARPGPSRSTRGPQHGRPAARHGRPLQWHASVHY